MQTALVVVNPEKIYESAGPPPALVTRVLLDDRVIAQYTGILPPPQKPITEIPAVIDGPATLHLPPGHRSVKFEFTAFDFSAPEKRPVPPPAPRRGGRLGGGRGHPLGDPPTLNNGDYDFQVTACNGDGDWSKTSPGSRFVVAPFFWQTWWFRSVVLAVFTGSIIAIVRYVSFRRLRRQLVVMESRRPCKKSAPASPRIFTMISAPASPRSLSWAKLAQQRSGCEPEKPPSALARFPPPPGRPSSRSTKLSGPSIRANDTLAHLIEYAGQFALDYLRLADIRCRLDFPEQSPPRELSTDLRHNLFLAIKEALHNIVKHAQATEVWLRIKFSDRSLEITIEDNGRGFDCRTGRRAGGRIAETCVSAWRT